MTPTPTTINSVPLGGDDSRNFGPDNRARNSAGRSGELRALALYGKSFDHVVELNVLVVVKGDAALITL
jgi:hypothetical protein